MAKITANLKHIQHTSSLHTRDSYAPPAHAKFTRARLTTGILKLRLRATLDFSTFSAPLRLPEANVHKQKSTCTVRVCTSERAAASACTRGRRGASAVSSGGAGDAHLLKVDLIEKRKSPCRGSARPRLELGPHREGPARYLPPRGSTQPTVMAAIMPRRVDLSDGEPNSSVRSAAIKGKGSSNDAGSSTGSGCCCDGELASFNSARQR